MGRIQSACICQTLHFLLKDELGHDHVAKLAKEAVAQYKKALERSRTRYRIVEETEQPDGSMPVKVIKQYNSSPVGHYLD